MAELAWPLIVANVSQTLLGVVDTAILGHLDDPRHLGGVAIGTAIFSFLFWGFGFLRMGTTGLTAQLSGSRAPDRGRSLNALLLRALLLAAAIGLITIAVRGPLFSLGIELLGSGAGAGVQSAAALYASIRVFGAPLVLVNFVATGWLMGLGAPKAVLATMVAINLANVALDLAFVVGLGMTVDGVALGSVLAEGVGLLVAATFIRRHWSRARPSWAELFNLAAYRRLIAINRDLFLRTLALLCVFAFFTAEGANQGPTVLAANAILLNFFTLAAHALDGFAQATEVLAGHALGGHDVARFHAANGAALVWCLATASVYSAALALLGSHLIGLFTDLGAVAEVAAAHVRWMVAVPLLAALCFLLDGVFIGATRARAMRDTMILATFTVALPVWWLSRPLGNDGLWLAFSSFFAARSVSLAVVYGIYSRRGAWLVSVNSAAASYRRS